jgi:hypothetical protein
MLYGILLLIGLVAVLAATFASRRRISPWWILLPGSIAAAIGLSSYSEVSTCHGRDSAEAVFGIAILAGLGLFGISAFTALFDAVRFVRSGETGRAAGRLVPLLLGTLLALGMFFLWLSALLSCVA